MAKTLANLLVCPLRASRKIPVHADMLAAKLLSRNLSDTSACPDVEALSFYSLNQAVAVIQGAFTPNEVLPDWAEEIVDEYLKVLYAQYHRLLHYTFLVVTREWRHLKNLTTVSGNMGLQPLYADMLAFHPTISDTTYESSLQSWLKVVPSKSLDDYLAVLVHSFDKGSWSGGYGGKPWGQIARTLHRHIRGETSAEVFIDTAYTLAHNNGPMFNKGMLYSNYTSKFYKILDVQRSGQICEGLLSNELYGGSTLRGMIEALAKALPSALGTYIDWYKVEALGSLHKYPSEKNKQVAMHGDPKANIPQMLDGQLVKPTGTFQWYPGQTVQIFKRVTT